MSDLFSQAGYEERKRKALYELRHAVEQGEKDQWFNALGSIGMAAVHATHALQSIINRKSWRETEAE